MSKKTGDERAQILEAADITEDALARCGGLAEVIIELAKQPHDVDRQANIITLAMSINDLVQTGISEQWDIQSDIKSIMERSGGSHLAPQRSS